MDVSDRLQPIFTVCYYHGDGVWNGPKSLSDIVDFGEYHEEGKKQFCDDPIKVINAEDVNLVNVERGRSPAALLRGRFDPPWLGTGGDYPNDN